MLKVSELYIYPIKSLAGIKVSHAEVTDRGFKYDRRWMLIDENDRFISQREVAAMALLKVAIENNALQVNFNETSIKIDLNTENKELIKVSIWDDECLAQLVDEKADQWFTNVLGMKCRLVYMPDEALRTTDPKYAPDGSVTSFADAYPFMMISQASLDELNGRLDTPLPMDRFRPNIVITGASPFQEDTINEFEMGGIRFFGIKLCARCNIPTIDQQTAVAGKEPSKTLAKYRLKNKKIYFGQNLIHAGSGLIAVGDEIKVLSRHTEDRFII